MTIPARGPATNPALLKERLRTAAQRQEAQLVRETLRAVRRRWSREQLPGTFPSIPTVPRGPKA